MTSLIYFVFLGILAFACTKWSEPVEVIPSYGTTVSLFTDESTGISHVMWCVNPDYDIHYRRLFPNGTVTNTTTIYSEAECDLDYQINGQHNGKNIYMAFSGRRDKSIYGKKCKDEPDICDDVYFLESSDGGDTWSEPKAVPRKDMHDSSERNDQRLLVTPQKRLFIFYWMNGINSSTYSYVVRAPDSNIFSQEKYVEFRPSNADVIFSSVGTTSLISIFSNQCGSMRDCKYTTYNNGIDWTGPEDISANCSREDWYEDPLTSFMTPFIQFRVCDDSVHISYMRVSKDLGKTWEQLKMPKESPATRYAISGNSKKEGFIAFANYYVQYLKIGTKEFKKLEPPPVPAYSECEELTGIYQKGTPKVWFWFNKPAHYSEALWVTWNDLYSAETEQEK